jgi:hypothetical protein
MYIYTCGVCVCVAAVLLLPDTSLCASNRDRAVDSAIAGYRESIMDIRDNLAIARHLPASQHKENLNIDDLLKYRQAYQKRIDELLRKRAASTPQVPAPPTAAPAKKRGASGKKKGGKPPSTKAARRRMQQQQQPQQQQPPPPPFAVRREPLTPPRPPVPPRKPPELEAFELFDLDRDGYIDHAELYRGLVLLEQGLGDVTWPQVEAMSTPRTPRMCTRAQACRRPHAGAQRSRFARRT